MAYIRREAPAWAAMPSSPSCSSTLFIAKPSTSTGFPASAAHTRHGPVNHVLPQAMSGA